MSRTLSVALKAHYGQDVTTIARCWKCVRTDSTVFGFTSHDQDITFAGLVYAAATGFTPSQLSGRLDLSVANLEVTGILDSSSITEADLLAGKWDDCEVEIFEVNYADLTMGRMLLPGGKVGNVSTGRVAFVAELRGLAQALQQPVGSYYTKTCQADLGDARCGVDLRPLTVAGTVTGVTSRAAFATALAQAADTFGGGVIHWLTGNNAGTFVEVNSFVGGAFVTAVSLSQNIQVGDTFSVTPGCRKTLIDDCLTRYNNVVRHRGFWYTPGDDRVLGAAGVQKAST